jgi:hypothetical protein
MALEKLSADEESRLRDINVQLDLGEVQGAQLAAADAQQARTAALSQGFQGMGMMAGYASELVPLYMQSAASKQLGRQEAAYNEAIKKGTLPQQFMINGKPMSYQEALGTKYGKDFSTMKYTDYIDFMGKQSKQNIKNLYDPLAFQFPMQQQQMQSQFSLDPFGFNQQPGIGVMTPEYYNRQYNQTTSPYIGASKFND